MRLLACIILWITYIAASAQNAGTHDFHKERYAIEDPTNNWVLDMVDSLRFNTDLCNTCLSPPTFKRYVDESGQVLYRLRYACDNKSSVIRIYDETGEPVTHCIIEGDIRDCNDFEAYTNFTFSDDILDIWSCKRGFNCVAKDRLGLFRAFEIEASGSPCHDKIRELSTDDNFVTYQWQSQEGVISNFDMVSINYTGQYHLMVSDQDGCSTQKQEQIHVYEEKEIIVDGDRILCEDEHTELSTSGFASYVWSNGDTTDHTIVDQPGSYKVYTTSDIGCIDSLAIEVVGVPERDINIEAGEDLFYIDQVIPIHLEMEGWSTEDIKEITWSSTGELSCDDCPNPFGKFGGDSDIQVMIEDRYGCFYIDDITVSPAGVYKDVYGANIFTPNGDGENDLFRLRSLQGAATVHNLSIYNRWGVPIFEVGQHMINDERYGWDGTQKGEPAPPGVYVYIAKVEFVDGSTQTLTGDVLLVN